MKSVKKLQKFKLRHEAQGIWTFGLVETFVRNKTKCNLDELVNDIRHESNELYKSVPTKKVAVKVYDALLDGYTKKKDIHFFVQLYYRQQEQRHNDFFKSIFDHNSITKAHSKLTEIQNDCKSVPVIQSNVSGVDVNAITDHGNNPMEQEYLLLISELLDKDLNEAEDYLYEVKNELYFQEGENAEILRNAFNIEGSKEDVEKAKEIFKSTIVGKFGNEIIQNSTPENVCEKFHQIFALFYNPLSCVELLANNYTKTNDNFWTIVRDALVRLDSPLSFYTPNDGIWDKLNEALLSAKIKENSFDSNEIKDAFHKIKNTEFITVYSVQRVYTCEPDPNPVCEYFTCYGSATIEQRKLSKDSKATHTINEYTIETNDVVYMFQKHGHDILLAVNQNDRDKNISRYWSFDK